MLNDDHKLFLIVLLSCLFFSFFLKGCNMQNRFLYFPEPQWPTEQMLKNENMKLWQAKTDDYQGLVSAMDRPAPSGTMVLFHGNGGTALDRGFYVQRFGDLGFRVLLAEYPKYGGRPGKVGEKPFVAAGLEAVQSAHEQYKGPIYLVGESLGCGVAAAVAKKTTVPIAGIILITPWDTLASVAKSLFPFLPVQLVLTDKYDNIGNLQTFENKISIVGAERDEILPIKHAVNLYNALPEGRKRMWIIKGAGHNDWPMYANPALFKEITGFVKKSG
jgi:hypothetical protein